MAARTALAKRTMKSFVVLLLLLSFGTGAMMSPIPAESSVLLGIYPPGGLQYPVTADTMPVVDAWLAPTGKRHSIAGTFMDIELNPALHVPAELNGAWDRGYVPFVNLATATRTSQVIASGAIDAAIHEWGRRFALWAANGNKRAFIAPLQEANGDWTSYHGDPPSYIAAFRRIRQIFDQELAAVNVPSTAISWVFAPNGWSPPGHDFERYYPGHDVVDIVSFSAYNYGSCAGNFSWVQWETYDTTIAPYLDRMRVLAPGKPIFLAEVAVVNAPVHGVGDKNQWLYEVYTRLAAYPQFRGALYFNTQNSQTNLPGCTNVDYRIHVPGTSLWQGFWNAMVDSPAYVHWATDSPEMAIVAFGRQPAKIFGDVQTFHPFALDPGQIDWAPWIHALFNAGITGGCSLSPLFYCPESGVTRGQMAVFLLRALNGRNFVPPGVFSTRFADVSGNHPFAAWIEAFADLGITSGCGTAPLRFCPDVVVTRAEMAVFLMKATRGAGFVPPNPVGVFADVSLGSVFAGWIEALAASGITGGCSTSPLQYCPGSTVTRQQMAVFLVRAFSLPK